MKKLIVIFLTLMYLVSATGFTRYSHLCKEAAVKQFSLTNQEQQSDKPCQICLAKEKGLTDKKQNCCKHGSQIVKVDNGVKKQSVFDFSVKFSGEALPGHELGGLFDFSIDEFPVKSTSLPSSGVPLRGNPLYILHCVYRI